MYMKEKIKQNKKAIVEMLNVQVEEGIEVAKKLHVEDSCYGAVLTNLLNAYKEAEQMGAEIEYDEEQAKLREEAIKKNNEDK